MEPYTHLVQYYETDKMGITHHSNYIRWMEEARTDYLEKLGYSYFRLEEEGICSPVVNIECDYKLSTTYNDKITIETHVISINHVKMHLGYEMRNEKGLTVFTGTSTHCFTNKEGKLVRINNANPDFFKMIKLISDKNINK